MPISRLTLAGLALMVTVAACGSDRSGARRSGTELKVQGVATSGANLAPPDLHDPTAPIPDPADATQVDISGTLTCDGPHSRGTGMFAATAIDVCLQVGLQRATLDQVGRTDSSACAQVYGGPQHASITGSIDGAKVDVSVNRADGCGIADWQRLEWLLGPPER